MRKISLKYKLISFLLLVFLFLPAAPVNSAEVGFISNKGVWFSKDQFFANEEIKIYTVVINNDYQKLKTDVVFYDNNEKIGTKTIQDLKFEKSRQVWMQHSFSKGDHQISIKLKDVKVVTKEGEERKISEKELQKRRIVSSFFVDKDTDGDNIGDQKDKDDDNDGLSDQKEKQLGTNPKQKDTDGDGYNDKQDQFPTDSQEWEDKDGDNIGDNKDQDDDNDELNDKKEQQIGSDPNQKDTDGDGLEDSTEVEFGSDPNQVDSDKDGVPDKEEFNQELDPTAKDTDKDNLTDSKELKLNTDPKQKDTDQDGSPDKQERQQGTNPTVKDTDGDNIIDGQDTFPLDPEKSTRIKESKTKNSSTTGTKKEKTKEINLKDKQQSDLDIKSFLLENESNETNSSFGFFSYLDKLLKDVDTRLLIAIAVGSFFLSLLFLFLYIRTKTKD